MTNENAHLKQEIKTLKELMDINKDAQEFYSKAQSKVNDSDLRTTLKEFELLHQNAVNTFKQQLEVSGASEDTQVPRETMSGKTNQLFTHFLAQFQESPDQKLVNELEEAEDKCLNTLEDAITSENLSSKTQQVLKDQLSELRKSHDHMRALKKQMAA